MTEVLEKFPVEKRWAIASQTLTGAIIATILKTGYILTINVIFVKTKYNRS